MTSRAIGCTHLAIKERHCFIEQESSLPFLEVLLSRSARVGEAGRELRARQGQRPALLPPNEVSFACPPRGSLSFLCLTVSSINMYDIIFKLISIIPNILRRNLMETLRHEIKDRKDALLAG